MEKEREIDVCSNMLKYATNLIIQEKQDTYTIYSVCMDSGQLGMKTDISIDHELDLI